MKLQIDETKKLKQLLAQFKALKISIEKILSDEATASVAKFVSYRDMACIYNELTKSAMPFLHGGNSIYILNIDSIKGHMDTVWPEQKRILEQVLLHTNITYASIEGSVDFIEDEFDNIENFIAKKLRAAIFRTPERENEVQNAIESLLVGRGLEKGIDYDRETGKFEFSGKEYIPDFIMNKLGLCIEVKLIKTGNKSKTIDEINADITAYSKQYERLFFVVYDLGTIRDEYEFKRDIEGCGNIKVVIIKH